MSAAAVQSWVHPFERAGWGHAPYRCVGYDIRKFQACHGAPIQPGATCDVCGTGIMHVYTIRSSDGVRFKVGCDCVQKTGDTELSRSMRTARWEFVNGGYLAQKRAEAAERERARSEMAARMEVEYAFGLALLRRVAETTKSDSVRSTANAVVRAIVAGHELDFRVPYRDEGTWRDDHMTLWVAIGEADMPESKPVGEVGKRLRGVTATLVRSASFDTMYGTKWVETFRTDAGETIVWKTTSPFCRLGARVTFDATVKEHSEYRGEKQTVIARAKKVSK